MQKFVLDFQHCFPPGVTVTCHKPGPSNEKKHWNISFLVHVPSNSLAEQILAVTWVFGFVTWISGMLQKRVFMVFRNRTLKGGFVKSVNDQALRVLFRCIAFTKLHPVTEQGIQILWDIINKPWPLYYRSTDQCRERICKGEDHEWGLK